VANELRETIFDTRNLRVSIDDRRETLGKKIRDAQLAKVPYMLIIGDKDLENGTVGVRSREEGDLGPMTLEAFLAHINK
jgi:threonyl-tRNA synthetase